MNMRKEIIDSVMWNLGVTIMTEFDIESEWDKSGINYYIDFLKDYCEKNPDKKEAIQSYLDDDIYFDELEDDLVNGNGEYWRQEFGIYDLEEVMEGDEVVTGFKEFCKAIGCKANIC